VSDEDAMGLVEVMGLVPAIGAADAMAKAAPVEVGRRQAIGSGFVTVVVRGEVAAVREAVDVGAAVAGRLGALVGSRVIGRPYPELGRAFGLDPEPPRPAGHGPPG
jgi:ethanolamine utilization protein EutM